MGNVIFFGEMVGGFGLFMAWAFWEYRKTQKLVEQDRKEAEALKQKDAAS
ncbi:MAG: hypothetical protein VX599_06335 [Pseudomonadota bacterium]|nr:hypothetical protein [Pseudomonadota bacterium]